jgi:hypothetical protein
VLSVNATSQNSNCLSANWPLPSGKITRLGVGRFRGYS